MNRMVGAAEQSLFFVSVPELSRLCWVSVSLQQDETEPRNKQMKTCRELVLLYSDILACPALDSFSEITLIMATSYFKKGIIQAYGQRHNLQVSGPQSVLPGLLQCCVSYSLTCRLTPFWNKAGAFLISGKDFLTENGRMSAVCMQFSTSEKQLCVSVEANTVRMSPTRLEDFDIPSMVLKNFWSHSDAVISVYSLGGNTWCHVLPSMKKGQIITISRQLNKDSPFRSYTDLQRHWNSLYGYRLPDLSEEEVIYCSVYFKPVGERLFTYPLSCIRLQPVERYPRLHQQGVLESFLCDITNTLHSVCGVPVRWTSRPRYHTTALTSSASTQVLSGKAVNLSTQSSSRAVVLTQHPASSSTPHAKPSFGPQPPASRPLTTSLQPPGAQSCGDQLVRQLGRTGSTEGVLDGVAWSSSSTLSQASSFSIVSPTPPPPPPPLSHHPVNPVGPKLVPIFHNQSLKPHVNITLLLAHKHKKQQEQPSRGAEERQRVSLPLFRKTIPPTAASSPPPAPRLTSLFSLSTASFSSSSLSSSTALPPPPPPVVPLFTCRPKSNGVPHAHPTRPNPSPNPLCNPKPSPNPRPNPSPNTRPNPLSNPRPSPNPSPNPLSKPRPSPNPLSKPRPSPNPSPNPLSKPRPSPNPRPNPTPNLLSNSRPSTNPRPNPNSDPRSGANPTRTISYPRPSANPRSNANPLSNSRPNPNHSPISDPRSRPNFAPKHGSSPIPPNASSCSQGAALVSRAEPPQDGGPRDAPGPRALVPSDIPSNRGGDVFESKPKRPRPAVQDLDVEIMARNNQLSKVNSATLLAWLRGRGVSVRSRDKKEQLMLRVMSCLAEA